MADIVNQDTYLRNKLIDGGGATDQVTYDLPV